MLSGFFLGGCLGTRHLESGEKLLYEQKIKAPKAISKEDLRNLYVQTPNRKLLSVLPIHYLVWLYYVGEKKYDPEKFVRKKEAVEKKFDDKIANTPESKIRRINNLNFKKQKKVRVLENKIENGNTMMQ